MTARILDGKAAAAQIKAELTRRVAALRERGVVPGLGTVLVGDDPGSQAYVAGKHRDCAEVGISSIRVDLPADVTQEQVEDAVRGLNADPVLELMNPDKDVDGLHPTNLGRLVLNVNRPMTSPLPCTPHGMVELLTRNGIDLHGTDVCVLGRGVTVGRPLGLLLTRREINATVTLCHTGTKELAEHLRRADVVVAAAGVPGLVTAAMVKPGAVVLDVGITRIVDGESGRTRLVGDVAADVREVASWVAPMPGGVGPMTRALLLSNVVEAAERL